MFFKSEAFREHLQIPNHAYCALLHLSLHFPFPRYLFLFFLLHCSVYFFMPFWLLHKKVNMCTIMIVWKDELSYRWHNGSILHQIATYKGNQKKSVHIFVGSFFFFASLSMTSTIFRDRGNASNADRGQNTSAWQWKHDMTLGSLARRLSKGKKGWETGWEHGNVIVCTHFFNVFLFHTVVCTHLLSSPVELCGDHQAGSPVERHGDTWEGRRKGRESCSQKNGSAVCQDVCACMCVFTFV